MKGQFKINNQGGLVTVFVTIVFIVLFFLFASPIAPFMRDFVAGIFIVPEDAEYALLSKSVLVSRLTDAERELSRVRYQSVLFGLIAEENKKLRIAAGAREMFGGVTGRVLARPPQTHYDSLVIDLGSEDSVAIDDLVAVNEIALGRVTSVGAQSAVIELFSSPGTQRDVVIGDPQAVAVARGLGGGAFELSVPQTVAVNPGDIVRIPDSETLALGIVTDVSFEPTDISKIVRFRSPISFSELDFIRIASFP